MGTLQNELSKCSKEKESRPNPKKKQHKRNKSNEKFSRRDIENLMGVHRPTYERGSGGAFRQR